MKIEFNSSEEQIPHPQIFLFGRRLPSIEQQKPSLLNCLMIHKDYTKEALFKMKMEKLFTTMKFMMIKVWNPGKLSSLSWVSKRFTKPLSSLNMKENLNENEHGTTKENSNKFNLSVFCKKARFLQLKCKEIVRVLLILFKKYLFSKYNYSLLCLSLVSFQWLTLKFVTFSLYSVSILNT